MSLSYNKYKQETVDFLKTKFKQGGTVLDIGAGDGIWSDMLKTYFQIDGIEIFYDYVEMFNLKNKYRKLFIEDARNFNFEWYDIVIMGDVLEHMTVDEAQKIIEYIYPRCKELIIAVPYLYEQGPDLIMVGDVVVGSNIYQTHHQPDLTEKLFLKRYPKMQLLFGDEEYGYFMKKEENKYRKIAVYAMTKNEEKFAANWYDNVSEADYVTVLDTGSTDRTVEILRSKGAIVETKIINPWRFDVARNESMRLIPADADICVCVDLDELFEPGWAQNLREYWTEETEKMKYLYTWSHDETGASKMEIWYEKIHDNSGNWYWTMPVHEALTFKLDREPFVSFMPEDKLHLHHYPDLTKSRGQYLNLMQMAIQESPDNYMQNYYYARELMYNKRWQESIEHFNKVVKMPYPVEANQAAAYGFLGHCYVQVGDLKKAELSYMEATHYVLGVREPYINLMAFYYNQERYYALIDVGLKTLKIEKIKTEWYEDRDNYRQLPHDYLSIAFHSIGDYKQSYEHIKLALDYKPEDPRLQNNLKLIENKL